MGKLTEHATNPEGTGRVNGKSFETRASTERSLFPFCFHVTAALVELSVWGYMVSVGWLHWYLFFFFTIWTQAALTVYFCLSSFNDWRRHKEGRALHSACDNTAASSGSWKPTLTDVYHGTFVMSFITSTVFWGLYLTEPTLIIGGFGKFYYPPLLNHAHHTFPIVSVFLELLINRPGEGSPSAQLTLLTCISLGYFSGIIVLYFSFSASPYPFMEFFSGPLLAVFFGASYGISYGLLLFSRLLSRLVALVEGVSSKHVKKGK
eukprot:comp7637_c1_seq1/m.3282 comp7637_c1_seq1/g.3282  ORF comp7637_c1_seq1/g.3282 comp7637_c1_seq1/m.3282 type:complete len:263 (-) comp7637_c1_seq1:100-888(-)